MNTLMKIAIVVTATLSLTACGDVGSVKDTPYHFEPSITIGKAFDNREICEESTWSEAIDKYDRAVVTNRCRLKGSDTYFADLGVSHAEEHFEFILTDDGVLYSYGALVIVQEDGTEVEKAYVQDWHYKQGKISYDYKRALEEVLSQDYVTYDEGAKSMLHPWPSVSDYKDMVKRG